MTLTRPDTHADLIEELDAPIVRRIAEDVVRRHDERSLTGALVPVADPGAVCGRGADRPRLGLRPAPALPRRPGGRGGLDQRSEPGLHRPTWPARAHQPDALLGQVHELIERMLKSSGRRIDISQPFLDAMLPEGHRLHVVLEGISRGFSALKIRKQAVRGFYLHN